MSAYDPAGKPGVPGAPGAVLVRTVAGRQGDIVLTVADVTGAKAAVNADADYPTVYAVKAVANLQAQVNAAAATGGVVWLAPGSYALAAPITLPANLTNTVTIKGSGRGATTVVLAAANPRLLDFVRNVDNDVYRNVVIEDLTVDASAAPINTDTNHGIIGSIKNGVGTVNALNISFADITVRRVTGIGGPTSTDGIHQFSWIGIGPSVASDGPPQTVLRILIEDIDLTGGENGIYVGAFGRAGAPTNAANVYLDDVTIRRWRHIPRPAAPVAVGSENHVIVGHHGYGGRVRISNGYGKNCADVGIEVDTWDDAVVEDCTVEDAYNGCFYSHQFNTPATPAGQKMLWLRCRARRIAFVPIGSVLGAAQCHGWLAFNDPTWGPPPPQYLVDCSHVKRGTDLGLLGIAAYWNDVPLIDIDGLRCYDLDGDNTAVAPGATFTSAVILKNTAAGNRTVLRARDLEFYLRGTTLAGGTRDPQWYPLVLSRGTYQYDIDGFTTDGIVTNGSGANLRGMAVGDPLAVPGTTAHGRLKGGMFRSASDAGQRILTVFGLTQVAVPNGGRFVVEQCDFTRGGTAPCVTFAANGGTNQGFGRIRNNLFAANTYPVAVAAAVGLSPWTTQNADAYDQEYIVQGGAVTKIEVARDQSGVTFIDTGVTQGPIRMAAGEFIRITYTAAPTVTKTAART